MSDPILSAARRLVKAHEEFVEARRAFEKSTQPTVKRSNGRGGYRPKSNGLPNLPNHFTKEQVREILTENPGRFLPAAYFDKTIRQRHPEQPYPVNYENQIHYAMRQLRRDGMEIGAKRGYGYRWRP